MPVNPFPPTEVDAAFQGRFVVQLPELRVGGQGVVYRAVRRYDAGGLPTNDDVALKLHTNSAQDERVEREVKAMANVLHPCLATLLEEGTALVGGTQTRYVVWKLIEGEPLDEVLKRGPLSERQAARMAADVAHALSAIWPKHIVHRDIAPKNIMIKPNGHAVLIDLGGARHIDQSTLTAPGFTFGTPGYFSPEQNRAEHALTCASDIFTLGVVILECLIGRHPTNGQQYPLATAPPKTSTLIPSASKEMRAVVDRMLEVRAAFRPSLPELVKIFEDLAR